jgi:hypothetical protein
MLIQTEAQAIFRFHLPFAHCANGSLSFVRFKETNESYPFANGLNRLAHLCRNHNVHLLNANIIIYNVTVLA